MYVEEFKSNEDIAEQFSSGENERLEILSMLNNSIVHLAWYDCGGYSGEAWVIYEHLGKLYEIVAGHCSCYGLEDEWSPDETDWRSINMRDLSMITSNELVCDYVKELSKKFIEGDLDGVASIKKRMADSLRGI